MAEEREILVRARFLTTAAQLGGKHLKDANRELRELANQFTVAEYNALLMAIRKLNEQDRADNVHLPKLIFGCTAGGVIPDHLLPHYDRAVGCSPEMASSVREALKDMAMPKASLPTREETIKALAAYRQSTQPL